MTTLILLCVAITLFFALLWLAFPEKLLAWAYQVYQKQRMSLWVGANTTIPDVPGVVIFKQNNIIHAVLLRLVTKTPITIVLDSHKLSALPLRLLWRNHINIITPKEIYAWNEQTLLLVSEKHHKNYKKSNHNRFIGYACGNTNLHSQGKKRFIRQYFQLHITPYHTDSHPSLKQALKRLETKSWFDYIDRQPPLIMQWLVQAKLGRKSLAVADSTGATLTHERLLTAVLSFSKHLAPRLHTEQTLGVCLPASVGATIATLSLLALNKTMVNLNYTASQEALASAIQQSQLKTVITSCRFLDQLKKKGFDIRAVFNDMNIIYLEDIKQSLPKSTLIKHLLMAKTLPSCLLARYLCIQKRSNDVPMFILFSSGSEGQPKGVKLSPQNMLANIKQATSLLMEVEQDGTLMSTLPLFHAFGLMATLLLPLIEGIPFICHPDPRDSVAIGHLVNQYQATILFGTSTFFRLYAKSRGLVPSMFASLNLVVTGAERLLPEVRTLFEAKFNKPICEGYGTTELSPAVASNIPHKPAQQPNKLGTVGQPIPGCELRIVHPDTLEDQACGEPGHILVGGVNVMMGYLNNEQKNRDVLLKHDHLNWYKTGDKGFIDPDGYLSILGRYARFAKLGGEMVSLYAIERLISDRLNNENITLMATSVTDHKKGESIVLLFSGPISDTDLKQCVMSSNMNNLMKPKHYLHLDSIPALGSGKRDFAGGKKVAQKIIHERKKAAHAI